MSRVRINLWLARSQGISRRAADAAIAQGRVSINGEAARPGAKVGDGDRVLFDGVEAAQARRATRAMAFVYHKPVGVICSARDDSQRPLALPAALDALLDGSPGPNSSTAKTPTRRLLSSQRWLMVGRLDVNSSGVLLFVNDGDLCHLLMHPSSEIKRVYQVRVHGAPSEAELQSLCDGRQLDGKLARFESLREMRAGGGSNRQFELVLKQGLNREIRRLFELIGCRVSRLRRTRFANVSLFGLDVGKARLLDDRQFATLEKLARGKKRDK